MKLIKLTILKNTKYKKNHYGLIEIKVFKNTNLSEINLGNLIRKELITNTV